VVTGIETALPSHDSESQEDEEEEMWKEELRTKVQALKREHEKVLAAIADF
jgi:hypothetical protein